ncbi:TetR family transcriptional regulator, partial [Pseudomonas aeruginosa]
MARKTKEESQKTRDGILDAAERVFLEKGVGTTAMADLADAAGVSRGAVYGHYKNKIEVCLAMCDRAFGQIEVPDENARVPALDILLRAGMGFILDAAERVFLEKGVGTTAMADLADAAGVSRGAVYGHYKNKIE